MIGPEAAPPGKRSRTKPLATTNGEVTPHFSNGTGASKTALSMLIQGKPAEEAGGTSIDTLCSAKRAWREPRLSPPFRQDKFRSRNGRVGMTYKNWFLSGLLAVSFAPAAVSILNFEILNQSVAAMTLLFSLLVVLGGAHVWLTLAYYTDRGWLAHFAKFPSIFFLAPALILICAIAIVAQPAKAAGLSFTYAVTFINLWHHAKQNWGVLSMVGKIRSANVSALRRPLIYAWPFFAVAWCMQLPEVVQAVGLTTLKHTALVSSIAFLAFAGRAAWEGGFFADQDPLVAAFGIALTCYFLPLIFLYGKPYSLLIWAGAHSLQYYLMVLISLSMKRRSVLSISASVLAGITALAILIGLTLASYFSAQATSSIDFWANPATRVIVGAVIGVNLVHFWIDAFIWKFSNSDIRKQHGDAFAF